MERKKAKDGIFIITEIYIMVNGVIIKKMNLVNFIIILVKFIKVSGKTIENMVMEKCIIAKKYFIKDYGNIIKKMVMEFSMKMETSIKAFLLITRKMVQDILQTQEIMFIKKFMKQEY